MLPFDQQTSHATIEAPKRISERLAFRRAQPHNFRPVSQALQLTVTLIFDRQTKCASQQNKYEDDNN